MGYTNYFFVPPVGRSGGLALLWKQEVDLIVISSCKNYVDARLVYEGLSSYVTFVYGDPDRSYRRNVWDSLSLMHESRYGPWVLIGDFNDITSNSEKTGGQVRAENSFVDFRSFLSSNDLFDIPHVGNSFSWRGIRYNHIVHCRLDRGLANMEWFEAFSSSRVEYLRFGWSDHRPLILYLDSTRVQQQKLFRFDRRMKDDIGLKAVIAREWAGCSNSFEDRLNRVRRAIISWSRTQNMNRSGRINELQADLEAAMASSQACQEVILGLNRELNTLYLAEENFWRQRSRLSWLQLWDKNSAYFHAITRARRITNRFTTIEDDGGRVVYREAQFMNVISTYFRAMFTSSGVRSYQVIQEILRPSITIEQNTCLIAIPSAVEIKEAVFDIHGDKAPGPDGFSASFYHSNWEVMGPEIIHEVQRFFRSGALPRTVNRTHIRLIPKIANPRKVSDYRPIALCTMFYKIISKILTRRIQALLPNLISENQSAFVKGRAIGDNVLITHEVLHFLRTSKAKKFCSMAVKTDMSKAYDRLEWNFIEAVLLAMGFHHIWVGWIMECVRSVSYSFLFNASACGLVVPSRGIRQGDPLSPYLFIMCTEVLYALCHRSQMQGLLEGIKISGNAPAINHLLFADDTMFFSRTDHRSVSELKRILDEYEALSGQFINVQKSSIIFASKTPTLQRDLVKRVLRIENEGGVRKYLGLPELFGRRKRDLFTSIVDRIRQRSLSWSNRFLSQAGKKIMLQAVLQSMPTYAMSCFKLPVSLCKRIQSILTCFWWDTKLEKRNISWLSWKKMSLPIDIGGLGFRDIEAFNDSLLAKISWKIVNTPECLLARVLLGKYCAQNDFLNVQPSSSMSHGWRGVLIGRDILQQGLGITLGDGANTNIWGEPWLSFDHPKQAMGPVPVMHQETKVTSLLIPSSNQWDVEAVEAIIPDHLDDILAIVPSSHDVRDRVCWIYHDSGEYTVKSGYSRRMERRPYELSNPLLRDYSWKPNIWRLKTLPKIKMFLWKVLHDGVPSKLALSLRQVSVDIRCLRCASIESIAHILFFCPFAMEVWNLVAVYRAIDFDPNMFIGELFILLGQCRNLPPYGVRFPLFPWICWEIWKARNVLTFEATSIVPEEVLSRAIRAGRAWEEAEFMNRVELPLRTMNVEGDQQMMVCQSDASVHTRSNVVGLGWIFLDTNREIVHANSNVRVGIKSPLLGESLAMLHALTEAVRLRYNHVLFQSDSAMLNALLQGRGSRMETYGVLYDIRRLFSCFDSVRFAYIVRADNVLAHNLARSRLTGIG